MRVIHVGEGTVRAAQVEGGPRAEVLVGEGETGDARLGAAHVVIPPGGGMPEHAHGESEAVVVPRSGSVVISCSGEEETLEEGAVALIGMGERVSLRNTSPSEPASLLAFFAPAGFVGTLASWPPAGEQSP